MRDISARNERDRMNAEPESTLDWFLKGDIEKLEANLGTITNEVDQGRIRARINHLKKEPSTH